MSTQTEATKRSGRVQIVHDEKVYTWSAAAEKEIAKILKKYPPERKASGVLPLLKLAQKENDGWLPVALMDLVAETLEMPPIRVYEVASFYDMFYTQPVGKHIMRVCTNVSCMVCGSAQIVDAIEQELGIKMGETTADGLITAQEFECLGACCEAPMMMLDDHYEVQLTPEKVKQIVSDLRTGRPREASHKQPLKADGVKVEKVKKAAAPKAAAKKAPAKKAAKPSKDA